MKLVLTGGTGFVGRQFLKVWTALKKPDDSLMLLNRRPLEDARLGDETQWLPFDLLSQGDLAAALKSFNPTHLLHLGWTINGPKYGHDLINYECFKASLNLFEAFIASGGRRIAGVGTCFEYAPSSGPLSETSSTAAPRNIYAQAKLATWEALKTLALARDISAAWARLFYISAPLGDPDFGEPDYRLGPVLWRTLKNGQVFTAQNPGHMLDYLDVRDYAQGLYNVLVSEIEGPVNLAAGQGVTLEEVVRLSAEVVGRLDLIGQGPKGGEKESGDILHIVGDVKRYETHFGPLARRGLKDSLGG